MRTTFLVPPCPRQKRRTSACSLWSSLNLTSTVAPPTSGSCPPSLPLLTICRDTPTGLTSGARGMYPLCSASVTPLSTNPQATPLPHFASYNPRQYYSQMFVNIFFRYLTNQTHCWIYGYCNSYMTVIKQNCNTILQWLAVQESL